MPTCSTERTRITCAVVLSPPSISTARLTSSRAICEASFFCETMRGDLSFAHLVVQAVGAEDQNIARLQGESGGIRRDKHLRPHASG